MNGKFKCCKKVLKKYCCIVCFNIFHPSCLDRIKNVKRLSEHKIFCSNECERTAKFAENISKELNDQLDSAKILLLEKESRIEEITLSNDKIVENLQIELAKLNNENAEKNEYIVKLNNINSNFEESAYEAEGSFLKEINQQKRVISEFTKLVRTKDDDFNNLQNKTKKIAEESNKFQKDVKELESINRQMVSSIKILEADNKSYCAEILKKQ